MAEARRTQAERRDATRKRVLDATIDCVVEHGYADTSTRRIAKRAGVTIGALQHHFISKTDLMAAAMQALADQLTAEFMAQIDRIDDPEDRIPHLLDRVWDAHRSPLFVAGVELVVAARTDVALQRSLGEVTKAMSMQIVEGMLGAFADLTVRPGFAENVLVGLAALQGLALMGMQADIDADQLWVIARPQLLRSLETVLEGETAHLPNERPSR